MLWPRAVDQAVYQSVFSVRYAWLYRIVFSISLFFFSSMCISFHAINNVHPEIWKGSRRVRATNETEVGKIRNFQSISRRISETVQDRTKVTIND